MPRNITRWSPSTCQCVVETETEYDDNGNVVSEPKFLLMNEVCDKHIHLTSKSHRANHAKLSNHVIDLIEEAKGKNLDQVHQALAKATRASHKRDLMQARTQVMQHNDRITEEWNELVSFTHAYDSHIYDEIMKEQQAKNAAEVLTS